MNYYKDFDDSLLSLIDSIKGILYHRNSEIFDRLDFYNDEIYLEPLLYSYLALNDEKWLDAIIYGYEHEPKKEIAVFSNSYGAIYLPKIGYFITNEPNATFTLKGKNNAYELFYNGLKYNYIFESIYKLSHGIELILHAHPLLEQLFQNANTGFNKEELSAINKLHVEHLNKGLDLLYQCNHEYYILFRKAVKQVMLFNMESPNSFAVLAAHNMIFLNVKDWDEELFFLDHCSHEGAHVIFNTLTYLSKINLFKINYNTAFAVASGKSTEHSTIYLRFHGLFTFVEIIKSLSRVIENGNLKEENLLEARGRLAFQLKRFENSLKSFEGLDIFHPQGLAFYKFFIACYKKFNKEFRHLITGYDFSGQSYDFNSQVFLSLNPIISNKELN